MKALPLLVKYFVKTLALSLSEKAKSHLNLTAKDRARKYPFHVDNRLQMQHCNCYPLNSMVDKLLESF